MTPLNLMEPFSQDDPQKKDPLDRLTLILVLMIVWRIIGGC
jgi:hypothetical protein